MGYTHKRFIVRKYVMAGSAQQAIKKEKKVEVADVWIDEAWLDKQSDKLITGFGENKKFNKP